MEQIFLDMDGTIVDYHDRFYKIYYEAHMEIGEIPISKEEFVKRRRDGKTNYPQKIYEGMYLKFEDPKYLKYDKMVSGMYGVINSIRKKYPIKIVSFRANNKNLTDQLKYLGIHDIEVISQAYHHGINCDEKANMIQKIVPNPSGFIIGDTHFEILAGQKLNLITIATTWGDQSKETLQKYHPDFIVDSPEKILEIINCS
jgi:phosphoglycolate phosphatase-like HAD superfamily hydrolase